ncbi:hypothetical protein TMatcc_006944 [Talaromyces marneffei ATCC 18224]|uniref:Uncharacterized protein n=2 Tax=Talaromyces marneffei TaxID=37727 RepID=B6QDZ9_TALMQ|nr:uncharacterized protein EYB26_003942 [Talaromyces marneffei]EEA23870.1 conserved hypothetical protein [Talaromyces marneffei ATCC 18224]KAE8553610.1 hypothetical protein EYB25_004992 [Talaromyces marneffei]QGA16275.1 hypothetical protein EYB26_003942 [Talaromyces marneffei]
MSKGPLGRPPGSLNAPIAAFSMAVILCSYCVYSINTARRGAQPTPVTTSENATRKEQKKAASWVQKALEEEQKERKV